MANIRSLLKIFESFGFYNLLLHIAVRLLNKITFTNVMIGMTLTEESVNPEFTAKSEKYTERFVSDEEVQEFARDAENDLPQEFINQALGKADRCYAILDGGKLASYGWYTDKPTVVVPGLYLHFDPSWIYMYRGYTPKAYRGQRLHALGMAQAMCKFTELGYRGLISYVEASNFDSLRSVYRLGYKPIGKLFVIKLFGRYISWTTGSCSQYKLHLRPCPTDTAQNASETTNKPITTGYS
jgi:hypothetical protein